MIAVLFGKAAEMRFYICGLSEMLRLGCPRRVKFRGQKLNYAPVAELADAYGSGPYF